MTSPGSIYHATGSSPLQAATDCTPSVCSSISRTQGRKDPERSEL